MIDVFTQPGRDLSLAMMYQKANPYMKGYDTTNGDVASLEGKMNARASQLQQRIDQLEQQVRIGNGNRNPLPASNTRALEGHVNILEKDITTLKTNMGDLKRSRDLNRLSLDSKIRKLEEDIQLLGRNDSKTSVETSELKDRIETLQTELVAMKDINVSPSNSNAILESRVSILEEDMVKMVQIKHMLLPEVPKRKMEEIMSIIPGINDFAHVEKVGDILSNTFHRLHKIAPKHGVWMVPRTIIKEFFARTIYMMTQIGLDLKEPTLYSSVIIQDTFLTDSEKVLIHAIWDIHNGISRPEENLKLEKANEFIKSRVLYIIVMLNTINHERFSSISRIPQ